MGVCGVESESRKNKYYKNESPKNSNKHKKNDSKNKKEKSNKIKNNDSNKKLDNENHIDSHKEIEFKNKELKYSFNKDEIENNEKENYNLNNQNHLEITEKMNQEIEKNEVLNSLVIMEKTSKNFNEEIRNEKNDAKSPEKEEQNGENDFSYNNRDIKDNNLGNYENTQTYEAHTKKVTILIQLESGKLASGSYDMTIKIWDIIDKTIIEPDKIIQEKGFVLFLLEFERDKILCGTSMNEINLWDLNTDCQSCEFNFQGHELWINCLVKLDSERFASASNDATILIWNYYNGEKLFRFEGHDDCILSLIYLKNGKLCSGSADETIKIWDIDKEECVQTLNGHTKWVKCLLELNNGTILSGSDDQSIKIWNYDKNEDKYILFNTLNEHKLSVRTLCQIDEKYFASGSFDFTIKIWEINTWNCVETLNGHSSIIIWITNLDVEGKKILASCSDDNTIKFWEKNEKEDEMV